MSQSNRPMRRLGLITDPMRAWPYFVRLLREDREARITMMMWAHGLCVGIMGTLTVQSVLSFF